MILSRRQATSNEGRQHQKKPFTKFNARDRTVIHISKKCVCARIRMKKK